MNASIIAMFFVSLIAQVVGLNLLPYTKGLTSVPHTIGMFVAFALGLSLMSRVVNSGVNVSSIVPLMATAIPLSTIIFGVAVLGESASPLKILLLVSACGLVLVASYTHRLSTAGNRRARRSAERRRPQSANSSTGVSSSFFTAWT